MKKILITGGSGFIGSHLVKYFLKNEQKVAITTKYDSVFDNIRLASVWKKLTVIESDLRNLDSIKKIKKFKPDIIFHLAAYNDVGGSFENQNEALTSNLIATTNLLESLDVFEQFIYISTSEVYGFQKTVPFQENMIPQPISPYSIGKYAGELYANMHMKFYNKPVKIIRPFNAYGPGQSMKAVIPEIIIKCLRGQKIITTEGLQTREFNFVEDLVSGFVACSKSNKTLRNVYNIGSNYEIRIKDLVMLVHELTESRSKLGIGLLKKRKTDISRMKSDYSKFNKETGWQPRTKLTEGLKITIEWYKKYLHLFEDPNSDLTKIF